MTTREKWIIGISLIILIVVSVVAFGNPKVKSFINSNPNQADIDALTAMLGHVPTGAELNCDANRPGYDKDGNIDGFCGNAPPPYSAPCDPYKPGFDINGFLNIECGAGRKTR